MKSHQSSGRWAIKKIIIPLYPARNESVAPLYPRTRVHIKNRKKHLALAPTFAALATSPSTILYGYNLMLLTVLIPSLLRVLPPRIHAHRVSFCSRLFPSYGERLRICNELTHCIKRRYNYDGRKSSQNERREVVVVQSRLEKSFLDFCRSVIRLE